jgi:putative copper export protein
LILLKTALFASALLAASANQFIHLRKWHPSSEAKFARSITREVGFELAAVILAFIAAGFLTRMAMPMGS